MDNCKICGQTIECYVRKFSNRAFVDGKQHEYICHTCASVPKTFEYDEINDNIITYYHMSPYYLNDVKDLVEMGWSKIEAATSIKAVHKRVSQAIGDLAVTDIKLGLLVLGGVVEIIEIDGQLKLRY